MTIFHSVSSGKCVSRDDPVAEGRKKFSGKFNNSSGVMGSFDQGEEGKCSSNLIGSRQEEEGKHRVYRAGTPYEVQGNPSHDIASNDRTENWPISTNTWFHLKIPLGDCSSAQDYVRDKYKLRSV